MNWRTNCDSSFKEIWRFFGNFAQKYREIFPYILSSIWPESESQSSHKFGKINCSPDLLRSTMILSSVVLPKKMIATWCAIKHERVGGSFLFVLLKGYEQDGDHYLYFKTYFESNEIRW